jgi:hypothetical protein
MVAVSTMLNERATLVVRVLAAALDKAGFPAEALRGMATVESREDLGAAADLCKQLAVMFHGVDFEVTQAAAHAHFVLSDQAGRTGSRCRPCSFSMHPQDLHSTAAVLKDDEGLESHPLCSCYCQAGR